MNFETYLDSDRLPVIEVEQTPPESSYILKKGSVVVVSTKSTATLEKDEKHVR